MSVSSFLSITYALQVTSIKENLIGEAPFPDVHLNGTTEMLRQTYFALTVFIGKEIAIGRLKHANTDVYLANSILSRVCDRQSRTIAKF